LWTLLVDRPGAAPKGSRVSVQVDVLCSAYGPVLTRLPCAGGVLPAVFTAAWYRSLLLRLVAFTNEAQCTGDVGSEYLWADAVLPSRQHLGRYSC
jgi:hypothetical protein